jgi:hypothetical protein
MDSSGLRQELMVDFCEKGNETSRFLKWGISWLPEWLSALTIAPHRYITVVADTTTLNCVQPNHLKTFTSSTVQEMHERNKQNYLKQHQMLLHIYTLKARR